MAHELDNSTGRVAFAFTGDVGKIWHGLGQEVQEDASEAVWIDASGLGWRIESAALMYQAEGSHFLRTADEKMMLYRSDTHAALGVVSSRFQPVNPADQFHFFREFCKASGARLSTAGSLFGGKEIFASAQIGSPIRIVGTDYIRPFVMFHTANDGSAATTIRNVNERPVCNNTVRAAMDEKNLGLIKVSHRSVFDAAAESQRMAAWVKSQAELAESFRRLAQTPVTLTRAQEFTFDLLNGKRAADKRQDDDAAREKGQRDIRNSTGYKSILELFDGRGRGSTLPGVRGTAWGMFNAVTEYVDHYARGKTDSHRWASAQFGQGADLKDKALSTLLLMADA